MSDPGALRPRAAAVVTAFLLLVGGLGCGNGATTPDAALASNTPVDLAVSETDVAVDATVDLTLYFRSGTGAQAHLVPVQRAVAVSDDLPRRALELLLGGPVPGDGQGLSAPLPPTTSVLGFTVADQIATVDLSAEVLADAGTVGRTPEHEVLALAAIADTLTEFPTIERVRLRVAGRAHGTVAGQEVGAFWGTWGLPAELVRDDSVIGPPAEGDGVPDATRFSAEVQRVGDASVGPVAISNVRTRSRTTYLRLVVEVTAAATTAAAAEVPPVRATASGDRITLEISDVVGAEPGAIPEGPITMTDAAFKGVVVDTSKVPGTATVTLTTSGPREFRLHRLPNPTRIVLDVRKRA